MEMGLGWLGVGVGAVGFVLAYLMASIRGEQSGSGDECRRARLSAALTVALTIIFWAFAMRTDPPFSQGQTLGWGFLIGGLTGTLLCLVLGRLRRHASEDGLQTRLAAIHSAAFLAIASASLTYVLFRGNPSSALIGFAIGAAMASVIRFYLEGMRTALDDFEAQAWAIFAIVLAVGVVMAVEHFDTSAHRVWWSLPILMGVTVATAGLVAVGVMSPQLKEGKPAAVAISCLIAAVIVIGLSVIYSWRLLGDWRLAETAIVGIACSALAAWLISSMPRGRNGAWGVDVASVCALLVVAFAVVAFKLWSGLGIGIGLVAAWAVALPALAIRGSEGEDLLPRALSTVFFVWLSILLYRLFLQLYRPELGADLRVHYTFIGGLIGTVLPFVFVSSIMRLRNCAQARQGVRGDLCALAGAASIGLFAAASPNVLHLIWELKAVLGFMFGLTASGVFLLMTQLFQASTPAGQRGSSLGDYSPALLVIGSQLVAIQFTRLYRTLELTRATQIWVLVAAVVLTAAWFLVIGGCSSRSRGSGEVGR
ncbi:MAG: hypothetical protein N3B12_02860 [Armatimonadetes bacterium]|nr:hypothetical protein [Armatimonadota bacterium]